MFNATCPGLNPGIRIQYFLFFFVAINILIGINLSKKINNNLEFNV